MIKLPLLAPDGDNAGTCDVASCEFIEPKGCYQAK